MVVTMNRLMLLAYLCVLISHAAAKELSVTQYGARPNDGKDDAVALRRAVGACGEGDRLVFAKGTYDLFSSF